MSQELKVKISGLYLDYNEYSEVPEGSLSQADNIDINQPSVAEPRKGFGQFGIQNLTLRPLLVDKLDHIFVLNQNLPTTTVNLYYLNSDIWTSVGGTDLGSWSRSHSSRPNGSAIYITTSTGVKKLTVSTAVSNAGVPKALDMVPSSSASTPAWISTGKSVAYRGLWTYTGSDGTLYRGAPSTRFIYTHTGADAAVSVDITRPTGLPSNAVFQLYRSATVDSTIEPSDEMGLVGQISSGTTILDTTPDNLRGATLYTSESQEGLANQNELPPIAKDIDSFHDCMFYSDVRYTQRYFLTLNGVGGTSGLAANDTLTITTPSGTLTVTAKATETIASKEFKVFTSGTDSENVLNTVNSLVRVINRSSSTPIAAYDLGSATEKPGYMLFEQIDRDAAAFTVTSSNTSCWGPLLPSSGVTQASNNNEFVNGLAWSKAGEPESVPLENFQTVGSKTSPISRIASLTQGLYIFKTGGGLYRLTGYYPNFSIDMVDETLDLVAPETLQVINDKIYCLTRNGVSAISGDGTVTSISDSINSHIYSIIDQNIDNLETYAHTLPDYHSRKYSLYLPDVSGTDVDFSYIYDIHTGSWTKHTIPIFCGFLDKSTGDRYAYKTSEVGRLLLENRAGDETDYYDFGSIITISSTSGNTVTVSDSSGISIGDILYQSAVKYSTVVSVDSSTQVTINTNPGLTAANATIRKAISCSITWNPITLGNPGIQHQFNTAVMLFKEPFKGDGTLGFVSDLSQTLEALTLNGTASSDWGMSNWGEFPWGSAIANQPIRQWVPRNKQRAQQLTMTWSNSTAYSNWKLYGVSIQGEDGSDSVGKDSV